MPTGWLRLCKRTFNHSRRTTALAGIASLLLGAALTPTLHVFADDAASSDATSNGATSQPSDAAARNSNASPQNSNAAPNAANPTAPFQRLNPESFYGKDSTSGVYVRDSAVALEKFALGKKMQDAGEWGKSAEIFQEILDKYSDRVVPSQVDKNNNIYQYTSVAEAVREQLCAWPAPGLAAYRAHYETVARALMAQATIDDLSPLHQTLDRYFVTDAGKAAGLRLIGAYFERGEFAAAAWIGQRLLQWHPNLSVERPRVLYRTALAHHLNGDDTAAEAEYEELHTNYPGAIATVRGRDVVLADTLAEQLKSPALSQTASGPDEWDTFCGDAARSMVPTVAGQPGTRLYGVPLITSDWKGIADLAQRRQLEANDKVERQAGAALGVMPVVSRGQLFFQDNARVYAVDLESGVPLAGWAMSWPSHNGQYAINGWGMPRDQQMTVTVTDSSVLAILNEPDRTAANQQINAQERDPRLVCLDRATGRARWTFTAGELPTEQAELRQLQLGGSPLVVGDNVYVVGRGGNGTQFEDCYVLCFALESGRFKWASYVASANNLAANYGPGLLVASDISSLAYSGGRVYVISNLGAAAALDAYSGAVEWLNIYREASEAVDYRQMEQPPQADDTPGRPFACNPAIVSGGNLFVLPTDGDLLLIYNAEDGIERKRLYRSDFARPGQPDGPYSGGPDTLVGVVGNHLILAGANRICCVDWKQYDHDSHALGLVWAQDLLMGDGEPENSIRGRSFLTNDSVFVPTAWSLKRIDLRTGAVAQAYPGNGRRWDEGQGEGNVLVTANHVVIAGDHSIDVYTDLELARHKLDVAVAAAPDDPALRLQYAEVMFAGGKPDEALVRLDQAIDLIGGLHAMKPGDSRYRAYSDAMAFATRLASYGNAQQVAAFFDRASASASGPSQIANYRFARAAWARSSGDLAGAVQLYQQVLADPELRTVTVTVDSTSSQAAALAEKQIASILQQPNGAAAYAPVEKAAEDEYAAAHLADDAPRLLNVAEHFPNSTAAEPAMLAAAEVFETVNQPRQATLVLRQIFLKFPDCPRDQVLEAMARNYLLMPGRIDAAVSRLQQAAASFPKGTLRKPLKLPDGIAISDVTFAQAVTQLRSYQASLPAAPLPDFHLPSRADWLKYSHDTGGKMLDPLLPEDPASTITQVQDLVTPLPGRNRIDRVIAWDPTTGVSVYPVGSHTPLMRDRDMSDEPRGAAWLGQNLLVWDDGHLRALGPDSRTLWTVDVSTLPVLDFVQPAPTDDTADAGASDAPPDGNINQRMINVRMRMGMRQAIIVQNGPAPAPVLPPDAEENAQIGGAERVQLVQTVGDRVLVTTSIGRVFAIDSDTGKVAWQTRFSNVAIDHLVANEDFTVTRFADDRAAEIDVLDTYDGSMLARRSFPLESQSYPVNLALSPDGTLVWSQTDRLCIKDLYEPGLTPKFTTTPPAEGQPIFIGATQPDQLLINGQTIIALSDSGQFVRFYSLADGQPLQDATPAGGGARPAESAAMGPDAKFATGSSDWSVSMRIFDSSLYVVGTRCAMRFDVDHPQTYPTRLNDAAGAISNITDMFVSKDFVVLIDQPMGRLSESNKPLPYAFLDAFSRTIVYDAQDHTPKESGNWVHSRRVADPSGIVAWDGVQGGFYYLTGDHTLHFVRGSRP